MAAIIDVHTKLYLPTKECKKEAGENCERRSSFVLVSVTTYIYTHTHI